jgi:hypothetical protein
LRAHVKRSNYTVDRVITSHSGTDAQKLQYLTKYCKKLEHLKIYDPGYIGETLLSALPMAKSLKTLEIPGGCFIKLTAVLGALNLVKDTIEVARFSSVKYARFPNISWPRLEALRVLHLVNSDNSGLIVSRRKNLSPSIL